MDRPEDSYEFDQPDEEESDSGKTEEEESESDSGKTEEEESESDWYDPNESDTEQDMSDPNDNPEHLYQDFGCGRPPWNQNPSGIRYSKNGPTCYQRFHGISNYPKG